MNESKWKVFFVQSNNIKRAFGDTLGRDEALCHWALRGCEPDWVLGRHNHRTSDVWVSWVLSTGLTQPLAPDTWSRSRSQRLSRRRSGGGEERRRVDARNYTEPKQSHCAVFLLIDPRWWLGCFADLDKVSVIVIPGLSLTLIHDAEVDRHDFSWWW